MNPEERYLQKGKQHAEELSEDIDIFLNTEASQQTAEQLQYRANILRSIDLQHQAIKSRIDSYERNRYEIKQNNKKLPPDGVSARLELFDKSYHAIVGQYKKSLKIFFDVNHIDISLEDTINAREQGRNKLLKQLISQKVRPQTNYKLSINERSLIITDKLNQIDTIASIDQKIYQAMDNVLLFWKNKNKQNIINNGYYLGPALDNTYWSRGGVKGEGGTKNEFNNRDVGLDKISLLSHKYATTLLTDPDPETNPLIPQQGSPLQHSLHLLNYYIKTKDYPQAHFFMKHFPFGDSNIEITENEPYHEQNGSLIKHNIEQFKGLKKKPFGLMMGHITCDPNNFTGISNKTDAIFQSDFSQFSQIPASFNPRMISYIKNNLHYNGAIISDWYDMGGVDYYIKKTSIPGLENGDTELKKIILAIDAGVDCIRGIHIRSEMLETDKRNQLSKQPWFSNFSKKLSQALVRNIKFFGTTTLNNSTSMQTIDIGTKIQIIIGSIGGIKSKVITDNLIPEIGLGSKDIRNRSGIVDLIFRRKMVEQISGKKLIIPEVGAQGPLTVEQEQKMIDHLQNNELFRTRDNKINWNNEIFSQYYESYLRKITK